MSVTQPRTSFDAGSIVYKFFPFRLLGEQIQHEVGLSAPAACREDHGRLEVLIRGEGLSRADDDSVVRRAIDVTRAARQHAARSSQRRVSRKAKRAIVVIFEDELLHSGAVLTSRKTYVAPVGDD